MGMAFMEASDLESEKGEKKKSLTENRRVDFFH